MSAARRAAVEALIHQEKAGYSNLVLDGRLRRSGLTGRDKAFCTPSFIPSWNIRSPWTGSCASA